MNEELVVNENALLPEFLPDRLPGRENEIQDIAYNFKLALNGRKPANLLVYGPPGTGKTVVMKYVMGELEEYSNRIRIVYVNCWHVGTRYGILGEIARCIGFIAPLKGSPVEAIIKRMAEIIKKKKFFVVAVLDEMDRLIASGHGDVLYDISRMNEAYGVKISVVGIVNDISLVFTLDPRIRSSVINKDIEFRPYAVPALKKILLERAKMAFSAYNEDAIALCAAHAYKLNGDARLGISMLLMAGRIAEKKGLKAVDARSVEEAVQQTGYTGKLQKKEVELNDIERRIIGCIKQRGKIRTGDLYIKLKDINERTLRNYITKLIDSNIIEIDISEKKGKSRILKIKNDKSLT